MKDYWDLSEKERSGLTEDEVKLFVAVELMKEGLTKPEPPELIAVELVDVQTITTWHLKYDGDYGRTDTSIGFPTKEAAEKALALGAVFVDNDYRLGRYIARQTIGITPREEAISADDAKRLGEKIKAESEATKANDRAQQAHSEQLAKCEKATSAMWEDWRECREKARAIERIATTFAEYQRLAGDEWTATKFLRKAFDAKELNDAAAWLGIQFMTNAPPVAAEPMLD